MFVCFENKPIVILLLLFVILIASFSIGKARFQEFGTNQVGWGGFMPFSLFFPQAGPDPLRCCAPSLLHKPWRGASMKYFGAER